ncbi:MAG TPA: mycothiol system anti-sigma-R factor [Mycobacteriales bacterium]|nr:mycothiol system anti-sigma-R factor [Mycobacteriales bacterium]
MSCGEPHDTDCSDVLEAVFLYLDDECDETQHQVIRQHLDECSPCLRKFGIEQDVKALVARKCGGDVAPVYLRERLRARLADAVVEIAVVESVEIESVEVEPRPE